ncbi:hypothetical protein KBB49_02985 [Candidatus Saccharibacteria bacterium]|jgi:hypothetical protein|nr:hypothetical protein [Candidatus Saccharibacteria bacterium]
MVAGESCGSVPPEVWGPDIRKQNPKEIEVRRDRLLELLKRVGFDTQAPTLDMALVSKA